MQPNLNMIAPAKSPSDSRKRVRCDEIPATPEMGAKSPKSSKEQRSPDASDVPELSLDRMKDATGLQRHWNNQPALPSYEPVSLHEVNAEWARMTSHRPPFAPPKANNRRISWSKKLHVTHVYYEEYPVDIIEYEWLKNELKKSQIEKKKLRQQVIEESVRYPY